MPKKKFYVVWKGRRTGIFTSWEDCSKQVTGFPDAEYKAFENQAAAEAAYKGAYSSFKGKAGTSQQWLFSPVKPILPSLSVDAACSGSPGPVEYRGVETKSGRQVFKLGPYPGGTNNVGEFLAIVHALAKLKDDQLDWPIYSDSGTALAWLKARRAKTDLQRNRSNEKLFDLLERAESWLRENTYSNQVLKWDTEVWGENPADFGRK